MISARLVVPPQELLVGKRIIPGEFLAGLPTDVKGPIQYDAGARALPVFLNVGQLMPLPQVQDIFRDLLGLNVCPPAMTLQGPMPKERSRV
jgi:hypothetical protein